MQTIYKKDSKGKIRFLTVSTEGAVLTQTSGLLGTENPIAHLKTCKGKNIGKANETTPKDQAIKEGEAIIKDKLTQGYFETEKEAETEVIIFPMLAKDFKEREKKIDWENDIIFVQPKLDGMRCLKTGDVLMSRSGKEIENMDHIKYKLLDYDVTFDGELYVHGEDFQTNMEYVKKYREGLSERIKYCIYDVILPHNYMQRRAFLEVLEEIIDTESIMFLPSYICSSKEELIDYHGKFLAEGYEGTMVRISKSGYAINKRSDELLKYKDFKDIACTIIDIGPAETMTDWGRPVVEWNGKQFSCGTKMSHEARRDLLTNRDQYIGKTAEIRYFEEYNTGIPRFPVMVGIREDK